MGADSPNLRPNCMDLQPLGDKIPLLDHGYVQVIETWGSDERIVEAARMSTQKGFLGWGMDEEPGDERLLRYLYKHWHETPFEMAGMVVEVQAPIMVFREWHRHRTQSYNEMSARYEPLPDFNYLPSVERLLRKNEKNKQANAVKGAPDLSHTDAYEWLSSLRDLYAEIEELYQEGLKVGIPKELARLPIPVGRYSRMRASANLRNWLAFMTLRSTLKGPDAQEEIRVYADALGEHGLSKYFPRTWKLFVEGR